MKDTIQIKRVAKIKVTELTNETIDGSRGVSLLAVTPEFAMEILRERNSTPADGIPAYTNRNLRGVGNKKTNLLIQDIEEGEFYPSLLKFSTEGALLDGQHRLYAITKSGKTCKMLVETGADPRSMRKIDIGRARNDKDRFGLDFLQNWNLLPKFWTRACQVGNGIMCLGAFKSSRTKNLISFQKRWSESDLNKEKSFQKNKEAICFAVQAITKSQVDGIKMQPFRAKGPTLTLALMHKINPVKAIEFANKILGFNEPKSCPSTKFRQIVLSGEGGESKSSREVSNAQMFKLFFCVNRYLQGKSIRKVGKLQSL
jgi:hypothetical protein